MEQNLPIIAKKVWSLMRVLFFILKKGISKTKFFADLNIIIKRGKLAGRALHNLLFHHHHHWAAASTAVRHHPHRHLSFPTTSSSSSSDSEFSCTTTPPHPPTPFSGKKHGRIAAQNPPPATADDGIGEVVTMKMLTSAATSPPPLFGKNVFVKELRITDSPFPVNASDGGGEVDEAAEMFIMRVYNDLRRQE